MLLNLKPFEKSHLPLWVKWLNDQSPISKRYAGLTNIRTLEAYYNNSITDNRCELYTVILGKPVGICQITEINLKNRTAEISVILDDIETKDFVLNEVLEILCSIAFKDLGLNRLSIKVVPDGSSLISILEKQGFQKEVRWRHHRYATGAYYHIIEMALLASEFFNGRNKNNANSN